MVRFKFRVRTLQFPRSDIIRLWLGLGLSLGLVRTLKLGLLRVRVSVRLGLGVMVRFRVRTFQFPRSDIIRLWTRSMSPPGCTCFHLSVPRSFTCSLLPSE